MLSHPLRVQYPFPGGHAWHEWEHSSPRPLCWAMQRSAAALLLPPLAGYLISQRSSSAGRAPPLDSRASVPLVPVLVAGRGEALFAHTHALQHHQLCKAAVGIQTQVEARIEESVTPVVMLHNVCVSAAGP